MQANLLKYIEENRLPISTGTRQHLVDAVDMEWMTPDTQVEGVLAAVLHQVLVGTDAPGLQSLR